MSARLWSSGVCAALVAVIVGVQAAGQGNLPEAAGREETIRLCGRCHEAQRAAAVRLTPEGWDATIQSMKSRGATGTDEEFARVRAYLVLHFLGEADRALNLNSADAVDIESVVGLLRREAAAFIRFREANGPFSSIEDLRELDPGILQKIGARSDRVVFLPPAATP